MKHVPTTRFRRGRLPHWEVEKGRYFITVRLADSLPRAAVLRLQEIHRSIANTVPRSEAFAVLQRMYFHTMEKYLDAGIGACVLNDLTCAKIVVSELCGLRDWNVDVPHHSIMPNHWHALIVPDGESPPPLAEIMKRVKGRTGKLLRSAIGGTGPIWQREWFDRWMRNDDEWEKTVRYIRNNPVRAGLVAKWESHPWTK